MRWFRARYGAGPIHLLCVIASFAVAAYALSRALDLTRNPDRIVLWLGGSIVAHDLLLFPLYAVLGAIAAGAILGRGTRSRLRIAALNHLRVPALLSGLLLLVWFPLVADKGERSFMHVSGLSKDVYFGRWLAITVTLFAGSGLLFLLRLRRLGRARRSWPTERTAGETTSRRRRDDASRTPPPSGRHGGSAGSRRA
jgi:hypothetical protein